MYDLIETPHFERRLAKFRRAHPDLKRRIIQAFADLRADPFQPRLRLHALQGQLAGFHAVSVTYEYRIVITLQITEREIVLIDIGSHDEVYR
jgi:mRNA-degrading endonuclease YafQ of YafQ-DinJ toxin-antitoxin module